LDKNTVIAIVLSILVILIFQIFIFEAPLPTEPEIETAEQQAPAPATTPGTDSAMLRTRETTSEPIPAHELTPAAVVPEIADIPQKTIIVKTPLYHLELTNRGMQVSKMLLANYRVELDEMSPKINAVFSDNPIFGTAFSGVNLKLPADIPYECDSDSLTLLGASGQETLSCSAQAGGFQLTKSFTFYPDSYLIDMEVKLANFSGMPTDAILQYNNQRMVDTDEANRYNFIGPSLYVDDSAEKVVHDDIEPERFFTGDISWAAMEGKYFLAAVVPLEPVGDYEYRIVKKNTGKENIVDISGILSTPGKPLQNGESMVAKNILYLGPKEIGTLETAGNHLESAIDFGYFEVLAKPMLALMTLFNSWVGNWGIAIIILTILIKIVFFPLSQKSMTSMRRMQVKMQKFQPELKTLQEKHKNDRTKLNTEMMSLYKKHDINPATQMAGCLPLLIQIPIFIALYQALLNSIELRHAPFFLYITDLSSPEMLFSIPLFGGLPVRPMPLIMGGLMFLQQRLTPQTGDANMKTIMYLMPVMMTFIFYSFPAGLVLYWLINNILSIGQQYLVNRSFPAEN
jgi:YidC/Oxa1 family membrane protein insertase